MYKKIVVPVEPSHVEKHQQAMQMAQQLADASGAEITALTVVEPVPGYVSMAENIPDIQFQAGKKILADLEAFVGGAANIKTKVLHGHAANEIIEFATKTGADCIVIASHKPGFSDYFLGSTAARVVRHSPCSVHVMR